MKTVKTARGKILNMGALAAQNEETRAISNMPINARGDIIDNRGKVKIAREDISKEFYKDNVPGSDEKEIGIKEEIEAKEEEATSIPEPKPEPKPAPKKAQPVKEDKPVEISRNERERADGSKYFEVEYMDGSMEEIEIPQNKDEK
jgi:hypothetical protein